MARDTGVTRTMAGAAKENLEPVSRQGPSLILTSPNLQANLLEV